MSGRRLVTALVAGAAVALSVGLLAAPAGAQDSTSTSLGISPSTTTYGDEQAVTFSSTVTDTTTSTNTPTGTVTVATGSTTLCIIDLPATSCTTGATTLSASGTAYAVTASYTSDDPSSFDNSVSGSDGLTVGQAAGSVSISNIPTSAAVGGSFTPSYTVPSGDNGATSVVASASTPACTATSGVVSYVAAGSCTLTASVGASTDYAAATGSAQTFTIGPATATVSISNIPAAGTAIYGGAGFTVTYTVTPAADTGTTSVVSNSATTCTAASGVVTYVGAGTCSLTASVAATTDYAAATGTAQTFTIGKATPSSPIISNIPPNPVYQDSFAATVTSTTGDTGTTSVVSSTTGVCTVAGDGLTVTFVKVGTCTLTPSVATSTDYLAATGSAQSFTVYAHAPSTPSITNIPSNAIQDGTYVASVTTNGDGTMYVISDTTAICSVSDNLYVYFINPGTCTLSGAVSNGTLYAGGTGAGQSFSVAGAPRGYWLVGSDGGIFSFGDAGFYGSTGSLHLQRPVVGITPTSNKAGYWLDASDGGIFAFGDAGFFGSLPGLGLHPAGSGLAHSLQAPIVGMVPSITGRGYFMVGSDGGVFAFGDAHFAGSCPGIGGCAGAAVAVMPDATGNGYWLVTSVGDVYAFGDAPFEGDAPPEGVSVTDAVASPGGEGYWLLYSNGVVLSFGDAVNFPGPVGYTNVFDPATAVFPTSDGRGLWVASARGDVFSFGNAPFLGSMSATPLNGAIIAGFGF
jgi:hypothetical protein